MDLHWLDAEQGHVGVDRAVLGDSDRKELY